MSCKIASRSVTGCQEDAESVGAFTDSTVSVLGVSDAVSVVGETSDWAVGGSEEHSCLDGGGSGGVLES